MYTGSGAPTAADVALCVASPRRTTTIDVVSKTETTLELVGVVVGVLVDVVVAVVVTMAVGVHVEVPVDDDDAVVDGEAVDVIPAATASNARVAFDACGVQQGAALKSAADMCTRAARRALTE